MKKPICYHAGVVTPETLKEALNGAAAFRNADLFDGVEPCTLVILSENEDEDEVAGAVTNAEQIRAAYEARDVQVVTLADYVGGNVKAAPKAAEKAAFDPDAPVKDTKKTSTKVAPKAAEKAAV